jgi:hypothetical protein
MCSHPAITYAAKPGNRKGDVKAMCDERATRRSLSRLGAVGTLGGALLLDADPAWAGAINPVLVTRGARVSEP